VVAVSFHLIRFLMVVCAVFSGMPSCAFAQDYAGGQAEEIASLSTPRPEAASTPRLEVPREPGTDHLLRPVPTGSGSAFFIRPVPKAEGGIDWKNLALSTANFLAVEHTFRYATEDATRDAVNSLSWDGYVDSVTSLHGWGDGDEFIVNYVGHPMQGAVSNFIWQHDDRAYRAEEFGRNRRYWKAKLRGMAFAFAYSTQFEIGPVSEASLGNVQASYPQFGLVDIVVTPTVGMGWAVGEDAIDRLVVQRIETRVTNPVARVFLRGGLNPARSFANMMSGRVPWSRDDRPGMFTRGPEFVPAAAFKPRMKDDAPNEAQPDVAPFDFSWNLTLSRYLGNPDAGSCVGGGATAGFRLAENVQLISEVDGCRMVEWKANWSGDNLSYVAGPRWTVLTSNRWIPHFEVLAGGMKITQEYKDPVKEAEANQFPDQTLQQSVAKHNYYATDWADNAFTLHAGGGLKVRLNSVFEVRVADLSYEHTWLAPMNGLQYRNGFKLSWGLVLRMGTW
jgi:hypothetical protein